MRFVAASRSALATGALIVLAIVPLTAPRQPPPYDLGLLVAVAALAAVALSIAGAAAVLVPRPAVGLALRAATLWSACGLALLLAATAVAATAQTLDLRNIVLAQDHTRLFALRQPAAASVFAAAFALAADEAALRAVLGRPGPTRRALEALLAAAAAALGATLFLGGYAGPALPAPLWLALKTVAVAALLFWMRRGFSALAPSARLAIAWAGAGVALLNLAISLVVLAR